MPETPPPAVHVALETAEDTLRQIVFDTPIARHIEDEPAPTIVLVVRQRIWDNIEAILLSGDWPDRPRTLEEVEQDYRDWDEDKLRAELSRQAFFAQGAPAEPESATKPRKRRTRA